MKSMNTDVETAAAELAELMRGKTTVAITGAGISTDSGLPDYRGKGSTQEPSVYFDDFARDPVWQRWVWQRNQETWRAVANISPNAGHIAIARLEKAGLINGIATQNVDDLHQKAGSTKVAELHGSFLRADCLQCGASYAREEVDGWLKQLNPGWPEDPDPAHAAILAGANREAAQASTFQVAPCPRCGGVIKPAIVFFGESLPQQAMHQSFAWAGAADLALVVGTSLMVGTGMMVLGEALQNGAQCAIVNMGPTQADNYADLRIDGDAGPILARTAEILLD
ncbi:NAD-dependent protein deacetylase, SIR2 family [Actinobaculum suis]|uniref:protein acetyllysine N-acetyltransferase n=2 Tax=Actinobaculum suis TaxID=1657 RepID=A0A1G7A9D6_9ACTO|nr:NAD-dependent protein deacetylase, SIR2 family [Actinobaculum suis]VDG75424.1 NAD(P)(+)-protein-arginine ADP-ribosyltransferase [Actinobaculum suis]